MNKRGKQKAIIGGIAAVVVIAIAVGAIIFIRNQTSTQSQTIGGNTVQRPNFETLTPNNSSDTKLDNTTVRTTPNDGQVFSYTDTIDGVSITVNQQELPKNMTVDVIAKNLNATKKLTKNSLTMYVGTSEQGAQTAVFGVKNLLILIKSASVIQDKSWTSYAASLD